MVSKSVAAVTSDLCSGVILCVITLWVRPHGFLSSSSLTLRYSGAINTRTSQAVIPFLYERCTKFMKAVKISVRLLAWFLQTACISLQPGSGRRDQEQAGIYNGGSDNLCSPALPPSISTLTIFSPSASVRWCRLFLGWFYDTPIAGNTRQEKHQSGQNVYFYSKLKCRSQVSLQLNVLYFTLSHDEVLIHEKIDMS